MKNTTNSGMQNKPRKPYDGYPLFAHNSGRWAKKIRGRLHYFGRWGVTKSGEVIPVDDVPESAQAAVILFNEQRDDLNSGRVPKTLSGGLSVADLCNRFLNAKRSLLESDELHTKTFSQYYAFCSKLVSFFGKHRLVENIASDDFGKLRSKLSKDRGPVTTGQDIRLTRMVFKFGFDAGLIDQAPRYGQEFKVPGKRAIRKSRSGNPQRMFEADELRKILDAAIPQMEAMTLLGINCGFGQTDASSLPQSAIDLKNGWIDYPRVKTGIDRRCPLWPETVEALQEAIEVRPNPKYPDDNNLVFLTRRGDRWVRSTGAEKRSWKDSIGIEFGKLLSKQGLKQHRRSFYALRHTFQTIAEECRDFPAIKHVMGHSDPSMSAVYRERISDERLKAVTDTVRGWLWSDVTKAE